MLRQYKQIPLIHLISINKNMFKVKNEDSNLKNKVRSNITVDLNLYHVVVSNLEQIPNAAFYC